MLSETHKFTFTLEENSFEMLSETHKFTFAFEENSNDVLSETHRLIIQEENWRETGNYQKINENRGTRESDTSVLKKETQTTDSPD